ncbi:MAG: endolytic transglycosylase MltG [Patescibacteria group bacterium]|jgi:UPF0755 protein
MKKIVRYLLIIAVIFLATIVVVSIFYAQSIYRNLVAGNRSEFPYLLTKIFDRLSPSSPLVPILKAEYTIQILEGWTNQDIARYLAEKGNWTTKDFLEVAGSAQFSDSGSAVAASSTELAARFSFLEDRPKNVGLEGYLFPDTYRIYASSTVKEIIVRMLNNFNEKLTSKMRADIKSQGKTIYDIIIMASLIEKEAPINYKQGNNSDAKIISGIFWDRLKNNQALESDATLSYILKDNQPSHSGQELEINSPYNTYKYRGLPPGPICNPGLLAIEAAIYPTWSQYNYFLSPPEKNTVIYAKTYDEHLKNVYQYLR